MNTITFVISVVICINALCYGAEPTTVFSQKDYAFKRIFSKAKSDPKWASSKTLTDRIWLVRSYSSKFSVVSKPVSDRYMITCYGGPVDLVHFLCLAAYICSGKHNLQKRLYQEWVSEGGPDNIGRFNYQTPPEAHPDDLPSNALGALFGSELRKHNQNLSYDLETAFERFVAPLIPLPDSVSRQFSHREIVMGLPRNPDRKLKESRYAYFTAAPLVQCQRINAVSENVLGHRLCEPVFDPILALNKAGFRLLSYRDKPIIIRRMDGKKDNADR